MKFQKQIKLLLVFVLLGMFVTAPMMADESTPEADDSVVIDVGDEVPEADDSVVIDVGDEVPEADDSVVIDWNLWLDNGLLAIIAVTLIVIGVKSWQSGGDTAASETIDNFGQNRIAVGRGETWYQNQSEGFKIAFDNIEDFMRFLGQMTNLQTPESIANLMNDVQSPGAPIPAFIKQRVMAEMDRKNAADQEEKPDEAPH